MKLNLNYTKSVHENAAMYYEKAKETRKKIEGLEKAIEQTKKEIAEAKKKSSEKKKQVKIKREKRWYERFNWFYTSGGKLAIGGKSAQENDVIFAKYMEENDLFFHADIQGGSAVILKDGRNADENELNEVAQFTASFSNAWKNGNASVDVYAVTKQQLSKHAHGGFIPAGGFAIAGERKWFRKTKLGLRIGRGLELVAGAKTVEIIPENSARKLENEITIYAATAGKEKSELAKIIAKRLDIHTDELLHILPSGKSKIA